MPFADAEIRRAYFQGYTLGSQEARSKVAVAPQRFADEAMQASFVKGWMAGRKKPSFDRQRRLSQAQWYQDNKESQNALQRRRRRVRHRAESIAALPRLVKRIESAGTPAAEAVPVTKKSRLRSQKSARAA